jgi:hypothetical protein
MEEGLYEVDVKTLAVKELWADEQKKSGRHADLPGYHGKGLYSGQGRIVYANNGDHAKEALRDPSVPSGVLATWDGKADEWTVVTRNQFTEVTGPGGIFGSEHPESDPIWTIGWDHRSLILMCLDGGKWRRFRLPKSSHSYDGAHGWNTEWPRIRDIGEDWLLMTMHGAFWKFPKSFSAKNSRGIEPLSNYLKVIGDFARWSIETGDGQQDYVVFGCDDTAKNEFLNKRKAKGQIAAPQSQSNLWFVTPQRLGNLGPVIGRGGVWVNEDVAAKTPSDPFLLAGFERRDLHLSHAGKTAATIRLEVDRDGYGQWQEIRTVTLEPQGAAWFELPAAESATWARLVNDEPLFKATGWFQLTNHDRRTSENAPIFAGLAAPEDTEVLSGLIRARAENKRTLSLAVIDGRGKDLGYYELDAELQLKRVEDAKTHEYTKRNTVIPTGVITTDAASVIFVDDAGRRWRLPRGGADFDKEPGFGPARIAREVATERDLFNAHGTFYELPAENAGGFAKVRPVATHNCRIHDFCSYRGLFVMTGVKTNAAASKHLLRSDDGRAALWVGAIDDVWQLGRPCGQGGPWKETAVKAGVASDPYLMTAYDRKTLTLSHASDQAVTMRVELDVTGAGLWRTYRAFAVDPGKEMTYAFPDHINAYWLRIVADQDCLATAQLKYE